MATLVWSRVGFGCPVRKKGGTPERIFVFETWQVNLFRGSTTVLKSFISTTNCTSGGQSKYLSTFLFVGSLLLAVLNVLRYQ